MENEPVVHVGSKSKSLRDLRQWSMRKLVVTSIVVLVVAALGYVLISKLAGSNAKDDAKAEKVLTIADLNKTDVKLDGKTSDASVKNLTKEAETKISQQVIAKDNPIETVNQLASVLAATTNKTRPDQLADFIEDFLANHEDALWLENEYEKPDQAQVNYWKAKLYAKLVYNYQFMMLNEFTGSDGKPLDTTKDQLKYVDLYLALAKDPASHSRATEEYKYAPLGYTYDETDDFIELRDKLVAGGEQNG